jgi:aspartokinase-like uncharacterized kinase
MAQRMEPVVVKVGGSLYELPDLGPRLGQWLGRYQKQSILLVPGGGPAADVIRRYDQAHQLGEEACHWLALEMLALNARFLAKLLPGAPVVSSPATQAPLAILDMHAFVRDDELRPDHFPHRWTVTSDSLAMRVAQVIGARSVVLLKSVAWDGADWQAAAQAGVVDPFFAEAARQAAGIEVCVVKLRA